MLQGKQVLVVEDEAIIGLDLVCCLKERGCQVRGPCSSPEQAFREISESTPDIATLDVNLGGGRSSAPIARTLLRIPRPFVYVTANADVVEGRQFPAGPVVLKPFDDAELIDSLADCLRRHG